MISVCFLFFKIPLPRAGSYPSTVVPTGAKHRAQSPLERWARTIGTDRPEMESRPYEFLLQPKHSSVSVSMGSLGPGAHKVCLSSLSISGGYGV